jgi:hypothetical protein
MYDLMRKSILATTPPKSSSYSSSSNHSQKQQQRRPSGQHHLLYKNSPKTSTSESSNNSNNNNSNNNNSPSFWMPPEVPVPGCPTRLLIRRRSLRVVEEGGGTHIYAIRYPEDTKDAIVAEQATQLAPPSRQEQCPPKPSKALPSMPVVEGGDVFTTAAMASIPRQEGTY